jgi:hypothetical protein
VTLSCTDERMIVFGLKFLAQFVRLGRTCVKFQKRHGSKSTHTKGGAIKTGAPSSVKGVDVQTSPL